MTLDALDRRIVAALERDARISFGELAEEVGLSKTPCWKRVKALEEAGVIRGYSTRIDPARIGFGIEAFIQVSIDFEVSDVFEAAVKKHPLIRRCHATTGEADYVLQIVTVDMMALDRMLREELSRLPGVRRTVTSMAMREIKGDISFAEAAARALRG
ncbi:Lrp/AsnC family transcriptional regulator [Mesorhizobium sp. B2-6-2]|uniref:Lrp/AsnC family transcriptional regulator n=1 Tax=Mesorhizobium sp. B2-6-2 TaxID=2589915 RepID=UPI00112CE1E2|nr:Lrp/AsnC family transcriptional regulator [Mesorhizobium sp. B2-6-2]TPJ76004.1 Lrp/AsnC family transcriptional regulator [Mesorhizobium sp. B2-6-2]